MGLRLCRKEKRASRAEFALGLMPQVSDRGLTRPLTRRPAHCCSRGRRGRGGNKRGRGQRGWRGREAAQRGLEHVWRGTRQVLAMGGLWRVASAGSRGGLSSLLDFSSESAVGAEMELGKPAWDCSWDAQRSPLPPSVEKCSMGHLLCAWSCTGLTECTNSPTSRPPSTSCTRPSSHQPTKSPGSDRTKCPAVSDSPSPSPPATSGPPVHSSRPLRVQATFPSSRCPGC